MTPAEIIAVIECGMCHREEKRAECEVCTRKLRAVETVRRMEAVVETARERDTCGEACLALPYRGCTCGSAELRIELDALDDLAEED